eukprot:gene25731-31071_t
MEEKKLFQQRDTKDGSIEMRPLAEADYDFIIKKVDSWWGGRSMSPMLPRLFFKHFSETSFAATIDGTIVGFIVAYVIPKSPNCAYVHFVGVDPSIRGLGVGRSLYQNLVMSLKDKGVNTLECVTSPLNVQSRAFHATLGFSEVSTVCDYDGPGEDRVLLQLHFS